MIVRAQTCEGVGFLPLAAIPAWAWAAAGGATVLYGVQQSWDKLRDYVMPAPAIGPAPIVTPAAPQSRDAMTIPSAWNPDELVGQTTLQQRQVNAAFDAGARQSFRVGSSAVQFDQEISPWLYAAVAALGVALVMR